MVNRVVAKPYDELVTGGLTPVSIPIQLFDNGNNTWSESPAAGGGGGGAGYSISDLIIQDSTNAQGIRRETISPTGVVTFVYENFDGTVWVPTPPLVAVAIAPNAGVATSANQTAQSTLLGSVTEAAPGTDTASSGLNGRLQRIAQRLTTMLTGLVVAAGENIIGKTAGIVATPSTTVARPANTTAYAIGQLLANSVTAGAVTALQFTAARLAAGSATIRRGRMSKTSTTTAVSAFRLHLFSASPLAPTNGDGGAFIPVGAASYLGAIDFPSMIACTDGAAGNGAPLVGSDITFVLGTGQTVFGLIEVRAAYVPTSGEVFTVALEIFQN